MKYFTLFILLFFSLNSYTQNEFITTWQVSDGDLDIQIPIDEDNFNYDYTVDFGDGTVLNNQTETVSHTYASAGTYTVMISGQFPKFDGGLYAFDDDQLMTIEQWGNIQWESMESAFKDYSNLTINATDSPDLSNVTNMSEMFYDAESVNSPTISSWDVSNVTNMDGLFANADSFNQPLDNWDVSNVTNMESMFLGANSFNQSLNNWDVSNVTNMSRMFFDTLYNQALDNWDVSNVTDMSEMFEDSMFNQLLDNWDTSTVVEMGEMFKNSIYNQPLNSWDVSNVTTMVEMFQGNFNTTLFNQPLDNWDTSNVTDMERMFANSSFNQNINDWDVSSVTNMTAIFRNSVYNQPLDNWNVSSVTNMNQMFESSEFNQPINSWDVSNVTSMAYMFNISEFDQPLDTWDVSNVTNMTDMFNASDFNQDLSSWTFTVSDLGDFVRASDMDSQNYDLLLDRFVQLNLQDGAIDSDGLTYCDVFTRQKLIDDLNWFIGNDELGDDCNLNYISGQVKFDENGDGCDSNDEALEGFVVNASEGQNDISTLTDDQGNYTIAINQGNFSVSLLNLPDFLDATPSTHSISFSDFNTNEDGNDFCLTANQSIEDLSVELLPIDDARPGLESEYEIIIENNGFQSISNVQVTVNFEGNTQSFVSASQTPSNTSSDSLTFTISNLPVFSSEVINFTLLNEQPPNLETGDVLTFTADVTPDANDTNPDDNFVEYKQTVVNSYDPNDKLATQAHQIPDEKIDEYIDYKIRFQNKGTANAINVEITDTISDKLDWTTFQPINSSHDYRLELIDQEEINFVFDNINLPYESVDEEGSIGFVSFKIKPKSDVQIGDVIDNKAYIFFDFNPAIMTNTYSITIVDELSLEGFETQQIKVYPNPTQSNLNIKLPNAIQAENLKLFDTNGKEVFSSQFSEKIDLESLSRGLYILKIKTNKGVYQKKLIKK